MRERKKCLEDVIEKHFDLVVVGAGLSGASVALCAAGAGLKVLVIDRQDFAAGASAKQSQLFESASIFSSKSAALRAPSLKHEKETLLKSCPDLFSEINLLLPTPLKKDTKPLLGAAADAALQEILKAIASQKDKAKQLSKKELSAALPFLKTDAFSDALSFADLLSDSCRFVLRLLKSAEAKGAVLLNYVEALQIGQEPDSGKKVLRCRDRNQGKEFNISCFICVNACGGDYKELLGRAGIDENKNIAFRRTCRIVLSASALECNSAAFLPTEKEGTFVSLVPWKHSLLAGLIERERKDADARDCAETDLQTNDPEMQIGEILSCLNMHANLPRKLTRNDVKGIICGREAVIPAADYAGTQGLLMQTENGILTVLGVKLNNYRKTASKAVSILLQQLNKPGMSEAALENELCLLSAWGSKEDFLASSAYIETKAKRLSISPASIEHLIANYGAEAEHIVDLIEKEPSLNKRILSDFPPLYAELAYASINEMALCLEDFLFRRLRLAILNRRQCMDAAPRLAEMMALYLGWDAGRKKAELAALESALFEFDELEKSLP